VLTEEDLRGIATKAAAAESLPWSGRHHQNRRTMGASRTSSCRGREAKPASEHWVNERVGGDNRPISLNPTTRF
jgi:hypothetical protein